MSDYSFKLDDGTEFHAPTAEGLATLYFAVRSKPLVSAAVSSPRDNVVVDPPRRPASPPRRNGVDDQHFPEWAPGAAVQFLQAIRDAGPAGADTDTMMKALGINHPKALGGRSAQINRVIGSTSYSLGQVYSNVRTAQGRIWKARKSLGDALNDIQSRLVAGRGER